MRGIEINTCDTIDWNYDSDKILDVVKNKVDNFSLNIDVEKSGKIIDSKYGLCAVYGLKDSQLGSIVKFEDIAEGIVAQKATDGTVVVVLLGKEESISLDIICTLTDKTLIEYYGNSSTVSCKDEMDSIRETSLDILVKDRTDLWDFKNRLDSKKEKHWVKLNNRLNKRKR